MQNREGGPRNGKKENRESILKIELDTLELGVEVYNTVKRIAQKKGKLSSFSIKDLALCDRSEVKEVIDEIAKEIAESDKSRPRNRKKFKYDPESVSADVIKYLSNLLRSYGLDFEMTLDGIEEWLNE